MSYYTTPEYYAERIYNDSKRLFNTKKYQKIKAYSKVCEYMINSCIELEELDFWRKVYRLIKDK